MNFVKTIFAVVEHELIAELQYWTNCIFLGEPLGDAWQASHPAVDGADVLAAAWSHGSNIRRIHLCEVLSTSERNVGRRSLLGAG